MPPCHGAPASTRSRETGGYALLESTSVSAWGTAASNDSESSVSLGFPELSMSCGYG